jgi:hypothetical protein
MTASRRRNTLAAELDRTQWDYEPGRDRTFLLTPVGRIFDNLPWEINARYLGPADFDVASASIAEPQSGLDPSETKKV